MVGLCCSCNHRESHVRSEAVIDRRPNKIGAEKHRPLYHFTPKKNWVNDPNGLVYVDGEYHLFYQYHPFSSVWGPMHWGHAVSEDLIHWKELDIALYPDSLGYIYSGSAVYDSLNTSGLGTINNPPMIALFTYHDMEIFESGGEPYQYQGLAHSTDKGRTWEKYAHNPIIKNPGSKDFRDPKIFWFEKTKEWIALIASKDHVKFYSSPNLLDWTLKSEFGKDQGQHGTGVWECPDLFPLPVDKSGEIKWVLIQNINEEGPNGGSGTQYFIGDFDGCRFVNHNPKSTVLWLDYGKDNFAGNTWNNSTRRIFIGWMSNWQYAQQVPTETWKNGMTFPRELSLKKTAVGIRLVSSPIREIERLYTHKHLKYTHLKFGDTIQLDFPIKAIEIQGSVLGKPLGDFELKFVNDLGEELVIAYHKSEKEFSVDRTQSGITDFSEHFPVVQTASRISVSSTVTFKLLMDSNSTEAFFDGGEVVLSSLHYPTKPYTSIVLESKDSGIELKELWIRPLSVGDNTEISP